jgi:hypothetical protein
MLLKGPEHSQTFLKNPEQQFSATPESNHSQTFVKSPKEKPVTLDSTRYRRNSPGFPNRSTMPPGSPNHSKTFPKDPHHSQTFPKDPNHPQTFQKDPHHSQTCPQGPNRSNAFLEDPDHSKASPKTSQTSKNVDRHDSYERLPSLSTENLPSSITLHSSASSSSDHSCSDTFMKVPQTTSPVKGNVKVRNMMNGTNTGRQVPHKANHVHRDPQNSSENEDLQSSGLTSQVFREPQNPSGNGNVQVPSMTYQVYNDLHPATRMEHIASNQVVMESQAGHQSETFQKTAVKHTSETTQKTPVQASDTFRKAPVSCLLDTFQKTPPNPASESPRNLDSETFQKAPMQESESFQSETYQKTPLNPASESPRNLDSETFQKTQKPLQSETFLKTPVNVSELDGARADVTDLSSASILHVQNASYHSESSLPASLSSQTFLKDGFVSASDESSVL